MSVNEPELCDFREGRYYEVYKSQEGNKTITTHDGEIQYVHETWHEFFEEVEYTKNTLIEIGLQAMELDKHIHGNMNAIEYAGYLLQAHNEKALDQYYGEELDVELEESFAIVVENLLEKALIEKEMAEKIEDADVSVDKKRKDLEYKGWVLIQTSEKVSVYSKYVGEGVIRIKVLNESLENEFNLNDSALKRMRAIIEG